MAPKMKSCTNCDMQYTGGGRRFCPDCFTTVARCFSCTEIKPLDQFSRNRGRANGYHHQCRACSANSKLLLRYGITQEEFDRMVTDQDSRCAICNLEKPLVLDHCHATGKNRGLLCSTCNSAIGLLGEDAETLLAAVQYLERHRPRDQTSLT